MRSFRQPSPATTSLLARRLSALGGSCLQGCARPILQFGQSSAGAHHGFLPTKRAFSRCHHRASARSLFRRTTSRCSIANRWWQRVAAVPIASYPTASASAFPRNRSSEHRFIAQPFSRAHAIPSGPPARAPARRVGTRALPAAGGQNPILLHSPRASASGDSASAATQPSILARGAATGGAQRDSRGTAVAAANPCPAQPQGPVCSRSDAARQVFPGTRSVVEPRRQVTDADYKR